mmetsp:Transcript_4742/g.10717  ORF Transcript_4742/g.10717 Transcript_4742/m.10717 type:complete len:689 (-) Transcript_4742:560-2626(-)
MDCLKSCGVLCGGGGGSAAVVHFNVGGARLSTFKATVLQAPPGSKLRELIAGKPADDGTFFIDRDSRNFRLILNSLRDGQDFLVPADASLWGDLRKEALFYGLTDLAAKLIEANAESEYKEAALPSSKSDHPNLGRMLVRAAYGETEDLCARFSTPSVNAESEYEGAALPANEDQRLARLQALQILHTDDSEPHYQNITNSISALLGVPIALVSLVADKYQWFKSKCGLDASSTSRESSFCAHTFSPSDLHEASMFVVADARSDARFDKNPLVLGAPYIVFYAGCPLVTSDGLRLGALCAIDQKPHAITHFQSQLLVNLAQITVLEIERDELSHVAEDQTYEVEENAMHFNGGLWRQNRMEDALQEVVCLVVVKRGALDWPILYANRVFGDVTRSPLTSSTFLGESARSDEGSPAILWDWLRLLRTTSSELMQTVQTMWDMPSPFAVSAELSAKGGNFFIPVYVRFAPADHPLDVAAAGVRPVWHDESIADTFYRNQEQQLFFMVCGPQSGTWNPNPKKMSPPGVISSASSVSSATVSSLSPSSCQVVVVQDGPTAFQDVKLVHLLGQGAFGKVYNATWLGTEVAVKIIEFKESDKTKYVPVLEGTLSMQLAHPNVVQTYKCSTRLKPISEDLIDDSPLYETWIVQEWCDRGTLNIMCTKEGQKTQTSLEVLEAGKGISFAGTYIRVE